MNAFSLGPYPTHIVFPRWVRGPYGIYQHGIDPVSISLRCTLYALDEGGTLWPFSRFIDTFIASSLIICTVYSYYAIAILTQAAYVTRRDQQW